MFNLKNMSNELKTIKKDLFSPNSRAQGIADLLKESIAKNSRTAYESDWILFEAYCNGFALSPLPATPVTVADFLSNVRTLKNERYKPSSLQRYLVSIKRKHKRNGHLDPTHNDIIIELMRGIRRNETRCKRQASAMKFNELIKRVTTLPNTNKGIRDKALLIIGFGGAFRRSELASLKLSDVQDTEYGIAITLRKSKTDQTGKGIIKSFVYGKLPNQCPVRLLKLYIDHYQIQSDEPLFLRIRKGDIIVRKSLGGDGISGVIKRYFPALSPHSLRAGFITETARKGHSIPEIMQQTGHRSQSQVADYIRLEQNIKNNAIVGLF
jgi:integrase